MKYAETKNTERINRLFCNYLCEKGFPVEIYDVNLIRIGDCIIQTVCCTEEKYKLLAINAEKENNKLEQSDYYAAFKPSGKFMGVISGKVFRVDTYYHEIDLPDWENPTYRMFHQELEDIHSLIVSLTFQQLASLTLRHSNK